MSRLACHYLIAYTRVGRPKGLIRSRGARGSAQIPIDVLTRSVMPSFAASGSVEFRRMPWRHRRRRKIIMCAQRPLDRRFARAI